MLKTYWQGHYTKAQLLGLLQPFKVTEPPKANKTLLIDQPYGQGLIRITKSKHKGTDGRLLYSYELQKWEEKQS